MSFLQKEYSIKIQILLITAGYSLFLFFCQKYLIGPKFSYTYGEFFDHNIFITGTLFVLAIVPILLMPNDLMKPSSFFTWYIYFFLYIPVTILSVHSFKEVNINIIFFNIATFFGLLCIIFNQKVKLFDVSRFIFFKSNYYLLYCLFFICVGLSIFILCNISIKILHLNIYDVYEARSAFKEELKYLSPAVGYGISFLLNVFSPALLILALHEKKWLFVVFAIMINLFLYSIAGYKSAFFLSFFLLGLWYFLGNKKKITLLMFELMVFCVLGVFLIIDSFIFKNLILSGLFTRRIILIHGCLTAFYVKYFSESGFRYFSENSIIKLFNNNTYENFQEITPYIIGRIFLNKPNCHVNENFWANAYADIGISGVFLMSFLFAVVLYIFDLLSYNKNKRLCICLTFTSFMSFINTSFTTALISGGVVISFLIIFFVKKEA